MTDETSLLNLPYIMSSQAQKHVTHNEALRRLDALIHLAVIDRNRNTPPGAPEEGQRHLVGTAPTGSFSGHAGEIAAYQDGAWSFFEPKPGWTLWDSSDEALLVLQDGVWIEVAPETLAKLGINTSADATNRLALASAASLFSHDGAGHQLKLNKAMAGDTGSILFQTAWSGRAEMGLAGTDDFSIKVSPDGSAWTNALSINRSTARVGIGTSSPSLKLFVESASDSSIGSRATVNTGFAGVNLYDYAGAAAASFQYGNPAAGAFANTLAIATRHSSIPLKLYQGGVATGNERIVLDASGRIALINANVGVGTATPHASAQAEIASTTRGFLPPRMSSTQRDAIASPATGLMIFNTTSNKPEYWNGSSWTPMSP
jgi:hypothetical protein